MNQEGSDSDLDHVVAKSERIDRISPGSGFIQIKVHRKRRGWVERDRTNTKETVVCERRLHVLIVIVFVFSERLPHSGFCTISQRFFARSEQQEIRSYWHCGFKRLKPSIVTWQRL